MQDLGQISHLVGSIGVLQEITSVELPLAAEQLPIGLQLQVVETGGKCSCETSDYKLNCGTGT